MLSSKTITPPQLRSLHAIKAHPGWTGYAEIIQGELTATLAAMVDTAEPATLHWLRGRAKVLQDLQKFHGQVRELLEKTGHSGL